ncbi:hypothetical protein EW145_g6228 [Phellinidium pouzarii]|uniref:BTB domain-containing protein n=1 Tax=Phellinidium pouzarii TaxID=167371 RepID=A0A4S4KX81_9AGAM|nr:hypothetical protein EW145_g6228 [Phellinidium pouzarii]
MSSTFFLLTLSTENTPKDNDMVQESFIQPNTSNDLSAATSSKPIQHPEVWFCDGSIVLVVRDTMFLVHKTILARHSIIFRDMFSLPQPLSGEDCLPPSPSKPEGCDEDETIFDGYPVVHLYDSPEDMASLLYALYDGPCVSCSMLSFHRVCFVMHARETYDRKFGDNDRDDFRVVSGISHLVSKYMIDSLRCALRRVTAPHFSVLSQPRRARILRTCTRNAPSALHRRQALHLSYPSLS